MPMKYKCLCGWLMLDNTDDLPYKARLVADEDWNAFTESCESSPGYDWRLVTHVYQCPQCGRLLIEKPTGKVFFFKPEDEMVPKSILRTARNQVK